MVAGVSLLLCYVAFVRASWVGIQRDDSKEGSELGGSFQEGNVGLLRYVCASVLYQRYLCVDKI